MKYCEDYAALLDLFVDGELSPEEMADVQAHLDACPGCRAYVDQALAIRAAFPDAEDTEVPEHFAESVMAAVQAHPRTAPKPRKTPWLKVLAPLAACVALVALIAPMRSADSAFTSAASNTSAQATESPMEPGSEPASASPSSEEGEPEMMYTNDTAALCEEPQEDAPAEAAPEPEALIRVTPEEKASSKPDGVYFASLTLPNTAADLLADYTPYLETATDIRYKLTRAEYDALSTQLDPDWDYVEVLYNTQEDSETALVVLLNP